MQTNIKQLNAFRSVVFAQILFIIYSTILESKLDDASNSIAFFLVINVFTISSYLMLSQLTTNIIPKSISISLIILADSIGVMLAILMPLGFEPNDAQNLVFVSLVDGSLITACSIAAYYTVYEIFFEETSSAERIWGATCAYLYIGFMFGNIYDWTLFFESIDLMGIKDNNGFRIYTQAMTYSMNVMGGLDTIFPKVPFIIAKISVIESLISHLFIVLIVGRLVSK